MKLLCAIQNRLTLSLMLFVAFCSSSFGQEWVSVRVFGPIACWGTFDLSEVESELRELPFIYEELTGILGLPKIREWIELYVFEDEEQWREFLGREYPQLPYRQALFIKKKRGRGQLFLHRSETFATDLRHEGTHALLHGVLPYVPIWLDEGLAEYFEVSANGRPEEGRAISWPKLRRLRRDETKDPRATGSEWLPLIRERTSAGEIASLEELETLRSMDQMTQIRYADSWIWVNFLLNGPEEVRRFLPIYVSELLRQSAVEVSPLTPISWRVRKRYANPMAELERFIKKLN